MAISTAVSTFELLVKPLVQPAADILGAGRTIIQGYFLTISNLNTTNAVTLRVNFRAQSPNINSAPLLAFFDVNNVNAPLVPVPSTPTTQTYTITIPAGDTGLFLLQPNVALPAVVAAANTEIRGFVTLSLAAPFGNNSFNLLITPQQRGTFLPKGFTVPPPPPVNPDFDQLAYGLPTATGGAQVTLSQIAFNFPIANPVLPELATLDPDLLQIIQRDPNVLRERLVQPEQLLATNGRRTAGDNGLQEVMSQVIERLENLELRTLR
jgi:hypothetical protein